MTRIFEQEPSELTLSILDMYWFEDTPEGKVFDAEFLEIYGTLVEAVGRDEALQHFAQVMREGVAESQEENVKDPEELVRVKDDVARDVDFDAIARVTDWLFRVKSEWPEQYEAYVRGCEISRNRRIG